MSPHVRPRLTSALSKRGIPSRLNKPARPISSNGRSQFLSQEGCSSRSSKRNSTSILRSTGTTRDYNKGVGHEREGVQILADQLTQATILVEIPFNISEGKQVPSGEPSGSHDVESLSPANPYCEHAAHIPHEITGDS